MGITTELAQFTADIRLDRLPPDVVKRARFLVLDLVGNIVRARHDAESTPSFLAAARAMGMAAGNSGVFGDAARYTPAGAAFLNGALAHSLDFDDTHAAGSLHPGAPVIPAALAAGEMVGASGADVLAAIVAGYEMTCRIALALPAGEHYDRGFHPTATCGAFGAAAAAARVFGLTAEQVEGALGTVLSQCAGSLQFLVNGAWTKRFQVGWAATNGLMAATLVREGFKGAAEALEGRHGFLRAYAPNPNPARAVQDLGTRVRTDAHRGEAVSLLPLRPRRHRRRARAARRQRPEAGRDHRGHARPAARRHDADRHAAGEEGQPAERGGRPVQRPVRHLGRAGDRRDGLGQLRPAAATRRCAACCRRCTCEFDPEIEAEFPANMSGKLTIAARGESFTQKVVVPKGEPSNFLTEAELRAKFAGLTDAVLGAERAARLADAVLAIDTTSGRRQPDAPGVTADAGAAGGGVGRPFGALV